MAQVSEEVAKKSTLQYLILMNKKELFKYVEFRAVLDAVTRRW